MDYVELKKKKQTVNETRLKITPIKQKKSTLCWTRGSIRCLKYHNFSVLGGISSGAIKVNLKHGSFLNNTISLGPILCLPGNCDVCGWKVSVYAGLSPFQTLGFRSETRGLETVEFREPRVWLVLCRLMKCCVLVRDQCVGTVNYIVFVTGELFLTILNVCVNIDHHHEMNMYC